MFDDSRSKRVIFVAHCLLNQNSISDGTADYPSQFADVVNLMMRERIGLVQLPCPELACLGLDRCDKNGGSRPVLEENTRIRTLLTDTKNNTTLRTYAKEVVYQVKEYLSYGMQVVGLVGINRSPSCGVETTTIEKQEVVGSGLLIDAITEELKEHHIGLKMVGIKTSEKDEAVRKVNRLIKEQC